MSQLKLAARLDDFPEYVFARLVKNVRAVEARTGRKVLDFGAGTPDVKPSRRYLEKFADLVKAPEAHVYPGYGASRDFSRGLKSWYAERFGVSLADAELFPLHGAKDGISHLVLALFDEGDEILVPDPGYPAFIGPARMVGARPVGYDLTEATDFKINLANLEQKLSDRTKFIWVNFPANPTGQVATRAELETIVGFARRRGLFILYDNAYMEITFDGFVAPSILEVEGAKDIAIEIGSFSKTSSFAGMRMGWLAGNSTVIAAFAKVKSQMDSGLSLPQQSLAAYMLEHPDTKWHKAMIENYRRRREVIAERLKTLGLEFTLSKGSLFVWAKIPASAANSEEFCEQLLEDRQILLTPGTAFGSNGERYVRVSICVNIDKIDDYF